jgi:hypothetical protein
MLYGFGIVALAALGAGCVVAALVLELLAGADGHSVLWLPLARIFLALASASGMVALGWVAYRSLRPSARSPRFAGIVGGIGGLWLASLFSGQVYSAWLIHAVAAGLLLSAVRPRTGALR